MITKISMIPNCFESSSSPVSLIAVLKDILNSGALVADFSTGNWIKTIKTSFLKDVEQKHRDKIITLLDTIKNRKKIVKMTNYKHTISNMNDWIDVSKIHIDNGYIQLVVSGKQSIDFCKNNLDNKCLIIDEVLLEDSWDELKKRDIIVTKTPTNFTNILKTFLPDITYIKFIDPYFSDSVSYKKLLTICMNNLRKREGIPPSKGIIEIHTSNPPKNDVNTYVLISRMRSMIEQLDNGNNHTIKLFVWKDKSSNNKFHDRFIISNIFGFSISHSLSVLNDSEQEITWSLLSNETFELHNENFGSDPKFTLEVETILSSN